MKPLKSLAEMIFGILIISLVLYACSNDENNFENGDNKFRTIAYNSLSEEEKATIVGNWHDAEVINGTFKSDVCESEFIRENQGRICFFLKDENIMLVENQQLVAVIFNTVNDSLLGPILVIVDPNTEIAVGFAARL